MKKAKVIHVDYSLLQVHEKIIRRTDLEKKLKIKKRKKLPKKKLHMQRNKAKNIQSAKI